MLGIVAFTAMNTYDAVQNLREQYNDVKSGDLSTIHSWMTVHMVSHIYQVPEDYLYQSLHISYPNTYRHTTLYELANHKQQSVDEVIHIIQRAILTYRKQHPNYSTPVSGTPRSRKTLTPTPGRLHT